MFKHPSAGPAAVKPRRTFVLSAASEHITLNPLDNNDRLMFKKGTTGMNITDFTEKFVSVEPDLVNARYVRLLGYKHVIYKDRLSIFTKTITTIPGEKPRKHFQLVYPRNRNYNGPLYKCPRIVVTCDCKRFLFMWEWALWNQGAAEIIHSNGKPPYQKNPNFLPSGCKHLLVVLNAVKRHKL